MMLITIRVPDNAVKLFYSESDGSGYESEPRSVTMGMIVKMEREETTVMFDVLTKIEQGDESSRGGK